MCIEQHLFLFTCVSIIVAPHTTSSTTTMFQSNPVGLFGISNNAIPVFPAGRFAAAGDGSGPSVQRVNQSTAPFNSFPMSTRDRNRVDAMANHSFQPIPLHDPEFKNGPPLALGAPTMQTTLGHSSSPCASSLTTAPLAATGTILSARGTFSANANQQFNEFQHSQLQPPQQSAPPRGGLQPVPSVPPPPLIPQQSSISGQHPAATSFDAVSLREGVRMQPQQSSQPVDLRPTFMDTDHQPSATERQIKSAPTLNVNVSSVGVESVGLGQLDKGDGASGVHNTNLMSSNVEPQSLQMEPLEHASTFNEMTSIAPVNSSLMPLIGEGSMYRPGAAAADGVMAELSDQSSQNSHTFPTLIGKPSRKGQQHRFLNAKVGNGRFIVKTQIGAGSFGELFWGIDTWSEKEVAIKLEPTKVRQPQLLFESRLYKLLHSKSSNYHPSITRCNVDAFPTKNLLLSEDGTSVPTIPDSAGISSSGYHNGSAMASTASNGSGSVAANILVASSSNPLIAGKPFKPSRGREVSATFADLVEVVGFPNCSYYGQEGDYNIMVMDLLGPNLEDLFDYCHRQFSVKTVCLLADQMLHRLEYLHSKSFIHRDLKPENFVMGGAVGQGHVVYLIDFGLSKRFWDPRVNQHISYKEGKSLTGTARYCSVNAHLGIEQSRRDDLESLGYILLYFLKGGSLPWQGIKGVTDPHTKNVRISEKKISTGLESLCREEPTQILRFMKYVRELKFEEVPDYRLCREMFANLLEKHHYERDWVFDWVVRRENERRTEMRQHQLSQQQRQLSQMESVLSSPMTSMSLRGTTTTATNSVHGGSILQTTGGGARINAAAAAAARRGPQPFHPQLPQHTVGGPAINTNKVHLQNDDGITHDYLDSSLAWSGAPEEKRD